MEKHKEYWKKLYVDYEWTIEDKKEYLIGVLFNDTKTKHLKYVWFKNTPEFMKWLENSKWSKIKIYSHWGIKADFKFICRYLKKYEIGVGCQFITCFLKNKKLKLIDTTYLIPKPLEDIGKEIGFPKQNKSILYNHSSEINFNSNKFKEILKYNKRDCEILSKLQLYFKKVQMFKKMRIRDTIASTSFNFMFNTKKIKRISNTDIDASYRGGFCELFKLHGEKLKCYDINSLYPSVMAEWIANPYQKPQEVYKQDKNKAGIYFCKIFNYPKPISFIRKQIDFRNIYIDPSSTTTWLSTDELNYLENNNIELEIKKGFEVDKYFEIGQLIQDMYKLREDPMYKYPIKLCLNSSYGKFGEKDHMEKIIKVLDCAENLDYIYKLSKKYPTNLLDKVYYFHIKEDKYTAHRNIITASNITGSARVKLFNLFDKVKNNNVFYCDTDSVYTNIDLDEYTSSKLGGFKKEYDIKEALFLGRKSYVLNLNGEICEKMKGVCNTIKQNNKRIKKPIVQDLDMFDKLKEDFIHLHEVSLQASYSALTTAHEYMKTKQHEKNIRKILTFNPNRYREFLSFNSSQLYNTTTIPKSKAEIRTRYDLEEISRNKIKDIIIDDNFDTHAYKTYDLSLEETVKNLMEEYKYE